MALRGAFCLGCLRYLLVLVFASFLISCSGGSGGLGDGSAPVSTSGGSGGFGDSSAPVSTMLSWVAPATRENGSALPLSDIKSYRIYYGVEAGKYLGMISVDDFTATEYQWAGIPAGAYFVVMTTVDVDGRESGFSLEIKVTI